MPAAIETPEQLRAVEVELERYIGWLRESRVQQKVGAGAKLQEPKLSRESVDVIAAAGGGKEVPVTGLDKLLAALRRWQPPVLHLILADIASPAVQTKLAEWVRANGHPQALIQLSADRTIGGGVVIRTPNHLYDYSFRTRILANRDKLQKVIAGVR